MIDETLDRLEARIRASRRTGDDAKRELLELVAELRAELARVSETHSDDANTIVDQAAAAVENAQEGVEDSVLELEASHPRLVGLVQSFLRTLSDAGI